MSEPKVPTPPAVHRIETEFFCDPAKTDRTDELQSWRIFKMMAELVDGFETVRKYKLAATFFGSARCGFDSQIYKDAEALAGKLAKARFTVITGGASGVMEAANKGAFEAGGTSVGLNIRLPDEQAENKYTTEFMFFDYFFTRKVMLAFASEIYIIFPGGFGTMNEFLEMLTLVQTNKIKKIPILLYGKDYWAPLLSFFEKTLYEENHAIDKGDLKLYEVADSVDEAYEATLRLVNC
jgi:uncharacterized protein (TIGR00730 family)